MHATNMLPRFWTKKVPTVIRPVVRYEGGAQVIRAVQFGTIAPTSSSAQKTNFRDKLRTSSPSEAGA
jgi:hypothetical protein